MSTPPAFLLNAYPPPTAIWRVARLTRRAAGPTARLTTLRLGHLDFSRVDPAESDLVGLPRWPAGIRTPLLYVAPGVFLRSLTRQARRWMGDGGVVHYLADDLRPWVAGARTAVTIHGNPLATIESDRYYSFGRRYRAAVRHNLRGFARTARALVHTQYVEQGLRTWGYDGPIDRVAPAVDPIFRPAEDRADLRRRLGLAVDRFVVLSVSTAERRKNLRVVPEVMDRLPKEYLLLRVGPSVRGAQTIPMADDARMADLYAAADVLLFPTLEEGFGLPVIEAFASGLPVVASDIPVIREVAGTAARLADPNDPTALAAACRDVVGAPEEFSRAGAARANEYRLEAFAERLSAFYRRVGS